MTIVQSRAHCVLGSSLHYVLLYTCTLQLDTTKHYHMHKVTAVQANRDMSAPSLVPRLDYSPYVALPFAWRMVRPRLTRARLNGRTGWLKPLIIMIQRQRHDFCSPGPPTFGSGLQITDPLSVWPFLVSNNVCSCLMFYVMASFSLAGQPHSCASEAGPRVYSTVDEHSHGYARLVHATDEPYVIKKPKVFPLFLFLCSHSHFVVTPASTEFCYKSVVNEVLF